MKIYLNTIKDKESYELNDVDILNELVSYFQIKKFNTIDAKFVITKMDSIFEFNVELVANIDVVSSYTLKVFPYNMSINDTLFFTNESSFENDDVIYLENDYFDVESIIYSLIVTSLPINIHQENEKMESIDGVDVYSSDDVTYDSPFDKLKDLDLD